MSETSSDLHPSKLGTKEHWDHVYEAELTNFKELGDEGEIWFGTETVQEMVDWTLNYVPPSSNPSILEVGSGNGALLFALVEAGYAVDRISGIDYSSDAVHLSRLIAASRDLDRVSFAVCDFLKERPPPISQEHPHSLWDLLLDKGTFDAMALGEKDENGRSPVIGYPINVANLLQPGGYFLITSCNFTEDELRASFANPDTGLIYHSRIQHPVFMFGGKSGSICSSVAFQKPNLPS